MINGAIGGVRTLLWSILLLIIPLYTVALILREYLENTQEQPGGAAHFFRRVPIAVFTLFRCIVASECTTEAGKPIFVLLVQDYGWGFAGIYCATVVLMTFGLFNVIV